ncbi:MAG: NAD(P)/FAD-dependent oxidoreductase, partial [Pyrinomonadaceae bacterium]
SGTFEVAFDEEERLSLQRNFHALREVGVVVENVSLKELSELEPQVSSKINGANFYPRDWQVENRQLLAALRRFADLNAIEIIENKPVTGIGVENGKVTGAACNEINFFAEKTIIAAGAWTSLIKFGNQPPPFRIKPIRGQMIWFDCRERLIEKVIYGPRCYLVPRADGRILAGSTTEDVGFENFVTESAIEYLRNSASEILPALSEYEIAGSWSGLRPRSDDGLPILGNVAGYENMFVATGHYRNGILLAPMTAKIVAQKAVDGIDSEYFSIFSRDRFAIEIRSSGA